MKDAIQDTVCTVVGCLHVHRNLMNFQFYESFSLVMEYIYIVPVSIVFSLPKATRRISIKQNVMKQNKHNVKIL